MKHFIKTLAVCELLMLPGNVASSILQLDSTVVVLLSFWGGMAYKAYLLRG